MIKINNAYIDPSRVVAMFFVEKDEANTRPSLNPSSCIKILLDTNQQINWEFSTIVEAEEAMESIADKLNEWYAEEVYDNSSCSEENQSCSHKHSCCAPHHTGSCSSCCSSHGQSCSHKHSCCAAHHTNSCSSPCCSHGQSCSSCCCSS